MSRGQLQQYQGAIATQCPRICKESIRLKIKCPDLKIFFPGGISDPYIKPPWKTPVIHLLHPLRGYCTSGPYFRRLFAFSQKIKQLWTKKPMDLVRNVPRNSKITVLRQWRQLLWSYSEKCAKINILHVLNHKSITTWVSEIPVQLLGSLECYL